MLLFAVLTACVPPKVVFVEVDTNKGTADTDTDTDTPPSTPGVSISPSSPEAGVDDLLCALSTPATDTDGDTVTYEYTWTVDGVPYATGGGTVSGGVFGGWAGPSTTIAVGDTVPVKDLRAGQSWTCTIVATADGASGSGSDTVTLEDPALVGDWPLDSGSAADQSGNALNGTISGATATAGHIGGALSFDGTDDTVTFGNSSMFELGEGMTVAAWTKQRSGATEYGCVLTKRTCCNDIDDIAWTLQMNVYDMSLIVRAGASGLTAASAGTLSDEAWHFFAGVYDGSEVRIYRDGVLMDSAPLTGDIPSISSEVVLGNISPPIYNGYWRGEIDEVRLWDRALLPEEIEQVYDEEM